MGTTPQFTIKGLKSFRGMEGQGFNCTLYRDGKKVAFVIDSANGGCYDYEWVSTEVRDEIMAYIKTLPPHNYEGGKGLEPFSVPMDLDILMDELVTAEQQKQWMKRNTKKHSLFRLKGDEEGRYRTVDGDAEGAKSFIYAKYGNTVEEFHPKGGAV